ncbi:FGGY-family carbohydrate kinase [Paenibacillus sp. sptzw28]|uniref:FGGY-family carbohydrate kinase n=1 Tax=Paenibacillus sp. sptzw28 TaxID=715179 RepID=UPI001C6F26BC|nr:FGGY-family carbohydrate kinase [Paenibacillus sp. sptzw28]QYR21790.1 FGGY-family carbohydrate kinase [Paenibacillus sp. sptzw28]
MPANYSMFIGVDIGTQGLRVVAMDHTGQVYSTVKETFSWTDNREQQDPNVWWAALVNALQKLRRELGSMNSPAHHIKAISVTSTSGTVIPLDRNYEPLHSALMYSDKRSLAEAEACSAASGLSFNSSFGLPKMVWFGNQYPDRAERIHLWSHAADFIIGRLSGVWGVTDYTNALKSGYDLVNEQWPDYIHSLLHIPAYQLPQVIPPGRTLGGLSAEVARMTGLPQSIQVVAGMTDGCASQVASGCAKPGDWNTTIGTTLVVKGITLKPIQDPLGRVYNHKHPQGYWMPGGASNTGADWITRDYGSSDLSELNQEAKKWLPTPWLSYPLVQTGERFPFLSAAARGFDSDGITPQQRFAARLEGVAYIERLSYECIESLSSEKVDSIYTAGGGSLSDVWLNIRSNILNKPIYKMKHVEGAVGAAIIAASNTEFGSLDEAVRRMVQVDKCFEPGTLREAYHENYYRFIDVLKAKGYLESAI